MGNVSAAKQLEINKSVRDIRQSALSANFAMHRVTAPVAKQLLLTPNFFSWGELYKFKAKSIGCGVYEVTRVSAID